MDFYLIRYLPEIAKISRQGQVYNVLPKKAYASPNYVDKKTLEFNVILSENTCTNFSNMHLCLPIQIKSKTDKTADIPDTLVTVNNCFARWLKEIDIRRCGGDIRILPTNRTVDIYRYSHSLLKQMSEKALKIYENTLLYSKKPVTLTGNRDRSLHTSDDQKNRSQSSIWII